MADSNTTIANIALGRAGATKRLNALETDGSPEALFLRDLLPQYRDELLEGFDWPFARRRALLNPLATVTRTDWSFVYAPPADMHADRFVVLPGLRNPGPSDAVAYRLEAGDPPEGGAEDDPYAGEPASQIILCDLANAELLYTGKCTNPARFSAHFTAALSWQLALDVALYLTKKQDLADLASRRLDLALAKARAYSANRGMRDATSTPDFMLDFTQPT